MMISLIFFDFDSFKGTLAVTLLALFMPAAASCLPTSRPISGRCTTTARRSKSIARRK